MASRGDGVEQRQENPSPGEALRRARLRIREIAERQRYHAFISFSGKVDLRVAQQLARALRHTTARWPWQRPVNVFVDVDCLSADVLLTDGLRQKLDDSARLILLASKESSKSPWVDLEVGYWRETRTERVLLAHTGGTLDWPRGSDDFNWDRTTALSKKLFHGAFPGRPVWAHLDKARRYPFLHGQLMRRAAATLVANLVGIEPRVLLRSELRRYRRRLLAIGTLVVATALGIGLAVTFANRAEVSERDRIVQRLLTNATAHAGRLDVSLLLTGQAYLTAPDSIARNRLMELGAANPGLRQILLTPPSGIGVVGAVTLSRGGQLIAVGTSVPVGPRSDPAVLLWPGTGRGMPAQVTLAETGGTDATSVTFDPTATRLAAGTNSGGIVVLTLRAGGAELPDVVGAPLMLDPPASAGGGVTAVSFSRDGSLLAASYAGGNTIVWNLAQEQPVTSFAGTASTFAPAGPSLASIAPAGGVLELRDPTTFTVTTTIDVHLAEPTNLAYHPDGGRLVVSSSVVRADRVAPALAIVDLTSATARPIDGTVGSTSLAYGPGDDVVTDAAVITRASSPNPLATARAPSMVVRSVAVDPAGGSIAYGGSWWDGRTGAVMLFDRQPTATLAATSTQATKSRASAVSRDGRRLAVTDTNGAVAVVDARTGDRESTQPRDGITAPTALAFSPNGDLLAAANGGRRVTIWTLGDGVAHDTVAEVGAPTGAGAAGLTFSRDGSTLAAAVPGGKVLLIPTATPLARPAVLSTGPTCDLAFSRDGKRLAVATPTGAQLWNRDATQPIAELPPASTAPPATGCPGTVAVRFALDDTALVAASGTTITVTHLDTRRTDVLPAPELNASGYASTNPHWDTYTHLDVSPDGGLLAASAIGSPVFLWDLKSLRQIGPALLPNDQVSAVQFGADGESVTALGASMTTWHIGPDYWLAWMCQVVQRELTSAEWQQFGAGTQHKECP